MAHVSGVMEKVAGSGRQGRWRMTDSEQMKDEGVNYYGMVSHSSLAQLLSQAGFCEHL